MAELEITTQPAGHGAFDVAVIVAGRQHAYRVTVPAALAARVGADPAEVARATIAFLLDREPPTSILRSFDCSVVPRYFRGYEAELPAYVARQAGSI